MNLSTRVLLPPLLLLTALLLASVASAQQSPAPTTPSPKQITSASEKPQGIEVKVVVNAQRTRLPIAVPNSLGESSSHVSDTLRRDLDIAGLFKIIPPASFFFDPASEPFESSGINFENWANVGAQGLIKSRITPLPNNQVKLDLRLYDIASKALINLGWSPQTLSQKEVTPEVHNFINLVIQYYTGQRGIFGTRIAYSKLDKNGHKQIYTMTSDGNNHTRITNNNSINILPTFRQGSIYFTSYKDDNPDLWVWSGGKAKKLSSQKGQNSGAALCGNNLAVTLSLGGENADIYLIDPNNGNILRRLTDNRGIDTSPTWNASCTKIAYVSSASGTPQIYVMNADGSGNRRLTFQGTYNTSPDWSPTEDKIVFTARDQSAHFDIFTVNLQGTIERLTQDQGNNQAPAYSPDGRYVTFISDRGGIRGRIWVMLNDGGSQRLITLKGSGYSSPSWER